MRCVFTLNRTVLTFVENLELYLTQSLKQTERDTQRERKGKNACNLCARLMVDGCWAEFRERGRVLEGGTVSSGLGRRRST